LICSSLPSSLIFHASLSLSLDISCIFAIKLDISCILVIKFEFVNYRSEKHLFENFVIGTLKTW